MNSHGRDNAPPPSPPRSEELHSTSPGQHESLTARRTEESQRLSVALQKEKIMTEQLSTGDQAELDATMASVVEKIQFPPRDGTPARPSEKPAAPAPRPDTGAGQVDPGPAKRTYNSRTETESDREKRFSGLQMGIFADVVRPGGSGCTADGIPDAIKNDIHNTAKEGKPLTGVTNDLFCDSMSIK